MEVEYQLDMVHHYHQYLNHVYFGTLHKIIKNSQKFKFFSSDNHAEAGGGIFLAAYIDTLGSGLSNSTHYNHTSTSTPFHQNYYFEEINEVDPTKIYFRNITFFGNSAENAGGLYVDSSSTSTPLFYDCKFINNSADQFGGGVAFGVYSFKVSMNFKNISNH